jgi:hypothetical protein
VLHKPSVCSSNQDSQQTAATARLELGNLSVNVYMLLMVSRFGQVELAACARLYQVLHKPCACSNSTTASRQQRAATEQFQPHIMQAFASTLFVCVGSVKQILQPVASFTWLCACCTKHAAATTTTGRQQNTEIAATAQPELSDVPMQAVYICLLVPVY